MSPLAVISYLSACKSQRIGTCQGQMPISDGQELTYCTGEGVRWALEISSGTWEPKRMGWGCSVGVRPGSVLGVDVHTCC